MGENLNTHFVLNLKFYIRIRNSGKVGKASLGHCAAQGLRFVKLFREMWAKSGELWHRNKMAACSVLFLGRTQGTPFSNNFTISRSGNMADRYFSTDLSPSFSHRDESRGDPCWVKWNEYVYRREMISSLENPFSVSWGATKLFAVVAALCCIQTWRSQSVLLHNRWDLDMLCPQWLVCWPLGSWFHSVDWRTSREVQPSE